MHDRDVRGYTLTHTHINGRDTHHDSAWAQAIYMDRRYPIISSFSLWLKDFSNFCVANRDFYVKS